MSYRGVAGMAYTLRATRYRSPPMTHPFHADDVDVDAAKAKELIDAGEVQLVDVREPTSGTPGGSPAPATSSSSASPPRPGRSTARSPVLFYCRLGARSGMAANAFRRAGYDAYSLDGGLTEWDRRELPLEPEDGTVAEH